MISNICFFPCSNTFILFCLINISIIYNIFAMFKVKDKDDKYYHLGLVMVSIILCILGIYKCM